MADLESSSFAAKSAQRHAALKAKWSGKRAETAGVEEETAAHFWDRFGPDLDAAVRDAERAGTGAEVEALAIRAGALRDRAATASAFLTPYDSKRAATDLAGVGAAVDAARARCAPRKRFGFGEGKVTRAAPEAAPDAALAAVRAREAVKTEAAPPTAPAAEGYRDEAGAVLVFAGGDECHLEGLTDCVVLCAKPLRTLRLLDCARCKVYAKTVDGPCYVVRATDCEVRVAPRQLRIHKTTGTTFHVAPASGPIVEDCDGLAFGRYAATWDGSRPAYDAAAPATAFAVPDGAWRDVKDFKWLKSGQSPHWAVLEEGAYAAAVPENAAAAAARLGLALLAPPKETPPGGRA